MEKIQIEKNKLLKLAETIRKEIQNYKIYLKLDHKNKKIYIKANDKLSYEEIKTIERIIKVYFEDYFLKILVD